MLSKHAISQADFGVLRKVNTSNLNTWYLQANLLTTHIITDSNYLIVAPQNLSQGQIGYYDIQ